MNKAKFIGTCNDSFDFEGSVLLICYHGVTWKIST